MAIQGTSYLTAEDVASIQSYFGTTTEALNEISEALLAGSIPEGFNVEDLLAYIMMNGTDLSPMLNPDNPAVAYLFTNTDVQGMLQESYRENPDNVELQAEIKVYLEHVGLPTDALNIALQEIASAEFIAGQDSEEAYENGMTIALDATPTVAAAYLAANFHSQASEAMDGLNDLEEERFDNVLDLIDEIEGYTDQEDGGYLQAAQARLQIEQKALEMIQACKKTLTDMDASNVETFSALADRDNKTQMGIINRI